jgi:hypothetical protein
MNSSSMTQIIELMLIVNLKTIDNFSFYDMFIKVRIKMLGAECDKITVI